jgi:ribose/xylose/arabinose/galactoside ABC-type transport system permease subunit
VLFVAAFAMDLSIMSLVYLASMLLVPLLVQQPVRLYWKAMLVYTEVRVPMPCPVGAAAGGSAALQNHVVHTRQ